MPLHIQAWTPHFFSTLIPFLFLVAFLSTVWLCSSSQMRGKYHNTKLYNAHRKGFIFLQTDFYDPLMLAKLNSSAGFCPLDFALLSFLFSPLLLENKFCIASSLDHTWLQLRCSVVRCFCLCKNPHQRLRLFPFKRPYRDQK